MTGSELEAIVADEAVATYPVVMEAPGVYPSGAGRIWTLNAVRVDEENGVLVLEMAETFNSIDEVVE